MMSIYPFASLAAENVTVGYSSSKDQGVSSAAITSRAVFDRDNDPSGGFCYRVLKRTLDLTIILSVLPLLLPVLMVIGVLVLLSSPGPVLYSHRRICRGGNIFSIWKFRTMCLNSTEILETYLSQNHEARSEWERTHKLRCDPRVTKIGKILRRFSLDELPQVWNIFRGHMSFVGPRPIVSAEIDRYGDSFSRYCAVKPGLTGLWQVSGRTNLTYNERIALDCQYINTWSLGLDTSILLMTFMAVISQQGAC
jgi:lipopolysaccharide/colanic/teichoic acid biosynthesis glycosyltransferase